MDYLPLIQRTIDYVDEHIRENISVDQLAKLAGFSTYHFYRVFNSYVGAPVMEYVARRKLQYALAELQNGRKIVDIAMDFGYDTHAGFTKAFKKHIGYPPEVYRIHAPSGLPLKIDLRKLKLQKTGGIIMQPKIINRDSFKVAGFEFRTSFKNSAHTRDVPAFWEARGLSNGNCERKLYQTLTPPKHGEYCLCINPNLETDEFSYILGVGVDDFEKAAEDMYQLEVPAATYAIFTTPPVAEAEFVNSIQGTWKFILEEWFPNSGYEIDDAKIDFEYYDERCHSWENEKLSMEIYVPVKQR
ncbi:MAG TPA: AraC family transcriptional regulator [Bacillota bacterium]|nr:AraC family transcriptional regulator [Bacillota bacterium]